MRTLLWTCASVLATLSLSAPAFGADMRAGESVFIDAGTVIAEDLYVAGRDVVIDGLVRGDVIAAGANVTVHGRVEGSVIAAGGNVVVDGQVGRAVRLAGGDVRVSGDVGSDMVAACGECALNSSGRVGGDMVAAGGSIDVAGVVGRSLKASGDQVRIAGSTGEEAQVRAARLRVEPLATMPALVYGTRERAVIASDARIGRIDERPSWAPAGSDPLVGVLMAALVALVTGALLYWAWPERSRRSAELIEARPGGALLRGLVMVVVLPLLVVIGLLTVAAFPVALLVGVLFGLGLYFGYLSSAHAVGEVLFERLRRPVRPFVAFAVGLLVLALLSLVPVVGPILQVLAVLAGLGSFWLMLGESGWFERHFHRRTRDATPPPAHPAMPAR